MDTDELGSLLSQLIPDDFEKNLDFVGKKSEEQKGILIEGLKALSRQSGAGMESDLGAFLRGEGEMLETTRTAITRGRSSAAGEVADFLKKRFKISAALAGVIAPLLVQLFPAIGDLAEAATPDKPRPRRKKKTESSSSSKPKKPKSSSSAKPASSSKPKKPKSSASSKPSSGSKPKKPKTSSSKQAKKKPKRTTEIPAGESE